MHNKTITEIFVVIVAVAAIGFLFGTNYDALVGNGITGKYAGECNIKHAYRSSSGECVCTTGYILEGGLCVEEDAQQDCPEGARVGESGECYCPHNKWLDEETNTCKPKKCPEHAYWSDENKCKCYNEYEMIGGECVVKRAAPVIVPETPPESEPEPEPEPEETKKVDDEGVVGGLPPVDKEFDKRSSGAPWGLIGGIIGGILALGLISIIIIRKFRKGGIEEEDKKEEEDLQEKVEPEQKLGSEQPITPVSGPQPVVGPQRQMVPPQRRQMPVRRVPPQGQGRMGPMPRGDPSRR